MSSYALTWARYEPGRNEDEVTAQKLLLDSGDGGFFGRRFEPKHGCARDRFAAFRTVLFTLTHRQDVSMIEWDAGMSSYRYELTPSSYSHVSWPPMYHGRRAHTRCQDSSWRRGTSGRRPDSPGRPAGAGPAGRRCGDPGRLGGAESENLKSPRRRRRCRAPSPSPPESAAAAAELEGSGRARAP